MGLYLRNKGGKLKVNYTTAKAAILLADECQTPGPIYSKYILEELTKPQRRVVYSREQLMVLRGKANKRPPGIIEPPGKTDRDPKGECRIMCYNTSGLSQSRVAEINHMLRAKKVDVLCLNETFLKPKRANPSFYGYSYVGRKDRPTIGGGVAILCKNGLKAEPVTFDCEGETLVAEIQLPTGRKVNVATCYNPPDKRLDTEEIQGVFRLKQHTILLGDLNAKHIALDNNNTNTSGRALLDLITDTNISILNNGEPTRVAMGGQRGEPERLDLALATPELTRMVKGFEVCQDGAAADHAPIMVTLEAGRRPRDGPIATEAFNYDRADWGAFRACINADIDTAMPTSTPAEIDSAITHFTAVIKRAAEQSIPKVQRKVYDPRLPAYLQRMIRWRWRCRRAYLRNRNVATCRALNNASNSVREAIKEYKNRQWASATRKLAEEGNPRKFWQTIHRLTKARSALTYSRLRDPDTQDKPENAQQAAQVFNNYLRGVMTGCQPSDVGNRTHMDVLEFTLNNPGIYTPYDRVEDNDENHPLTVEISQVEVIESIKRFNPRKAPGPDNIQVMLYREIPGTAIGLLTEICDHAMRLGYFPLHFKEAKVIMLPKPNKTLDTPKNYRPVSLTNTIGKVFERIIHGRLMGHLLRGEFFHENQHGFKPRTGGTDQILKIVDDVKAGNRCFRNSVLVSLDLEKAFDKVWHDGLIYKCAQIPDMPVTLKKLTASFLKDRKVSTIVQGRLSTPFTPQAGVPQGSILSPLYFNIYVNDIQNIDKPEGSKIYQYADDTCLLVAHRQLPMLGRNINSMLRKVESYLANWKLKANPSKTQIIALDTLHECKIPREVKAYFGGTELKFTRSATVLGCILDHRLSLAKHIKHVKSKAIMATNKIRILGSHGSETNTELLVRLYKTLVRSIMEYCPVYLVTATESQMNELQIVQNRSLRLAVGAPYYITNQVVKSYVPDLPEMAERIKNLVAVYIRRGNHGPMSEYIRLAREYNGPEGRRFEPTLRRIIRELEGG